MKELKKYTLTYCENIEIMQDNLKELKETTEEIRQIIESNDIMNEKATNTMAAFEKLMRFLFTENDCDAFGYIGNKTREEIAESVKIYFQLKTIIAREWQEIRQECHED